MFDCPIKVKCERCGNSFNINKKLWIYDCPKCKNDMKREGADERCICGHKQLEHQGNLYDSRGCSEGCPCYEFKSIKKEDLEKKDKEYLEGEGCKHFFKLEKSSEGKYKCVNCGCTTNFKPNYWPSVDD